MRSRPRAERLLRHLWSRALPARRRRQWRVGRPGRVWFGTPDAGSVTAEFAAVVPAVLLVLACCLGGVQIVGQQVRLTDAAADAARSLARGDGVALAAARVRQSVGAARMSTENNGDFVCVRLTSAATFSPAASVGVTVAARGCALAGGL